MPETSLAQLEVALAEFEQHYHLSSAEFYRQFQAGQTADRLDYTEWAALIQMANNLREISSTISRDSSSLRDSE